MNLDVASNVLKLNSNPLSRSPLRQIAILGTFLPRQCGIATFSADLATTLSNLDSDLTVDSVAMSDRNDYVYPERVCYEIEEGDLASYRPAADYINRYGYDVLSIQHEYGIFGGDAGSYLMSLVREAKMPIVTTLHTVLQQPTSYQKTAMDELLQFSERIVVMSHKAVSFLKDVHNVPEEKIDFIPHGIPNISQATGRDFRAKLKINGPMILTFGLLSPDKGIQYVIEAMPKIVSQYPGATYFVVGATHPNVRSSAGETYREGLKKLAADLGVTANVRFIDRFVATEELVEYLAAMDIYITPYLNPKQITSGTLAYAVGAGKAVISTPYWYAKELLDENRGVLVPYKNGKAIAEAVLSLERDSKNRVEMGHRAAEFGKEMLWPAVGRQYLESFARAKRESAERLRVLIQKPMLPPYAAHELPDMRLDHLIDLSDDTGILQHATFTIPNRSEGYCVDDNARALLLTAFLESGKHLSSTMSLLQSRYLSFVLDAYNPENGRFRNFMSYNREWLEEAGSEDSQGRSLWALGTTAHRSQNRSRKELAKSLFENGAGALYDTTSLRTWAYGILGADEYLKAYPHEAPVQVLMQRMASRLLRQFELHQKSDWPWFEHRLTYANARLPQAMLIAGEVLGNNDMLEVGMEGLSWLMKEQTTREGFFAPIGTNGFYIRGGERAVWDQQPVEAWASVSACLRAASISGDTAWYEEANRSFRWFLGENMLVQPVYDKLTGGCLDGLHEDRSNLNQGAESTLSFLCALAELRDASMPDQSESQVAIVQKAEIYEIK